MRLDEYQWSRNPRGLHVQRILITPLDFNRWSRPNFGWVKLIASGHEYVDDAETFLAMGITPVLRPFRARWGARPMDRAMQEQILLYVRAGVKWFEFYNEPNLGIEWPPGVNIDWRNMDGVIRPLIENWLNWAEWIISLGCYPGFIALAESTDPPAAAVLWVDAFLNYLAENHYDRFRNVLDNGMYVATHPYIFNHYYQEVPGGGPLTARGPDAQNAQEPGWHFEYPYDPICQNSDPGRTVFGGTQLTPHGDPVGLLAMGRMFNERAAALFGTQAVPVVGTEGGIWPFRATIPFQLDDRYPPYTEESQAEGTVAMFEWIAEVAPPWFFGVCLWKEDEYYPQGKVVAIQRMEQIAPIHRSIPAIPVMGSGYEPIRIGPDGLPLLGPGPIQGRADLHMVILPPGLEADWFFRTAQSYWNTFRPVVTTQAEFIDLIPFTRSLALTIIAPPDLAEQMTQEFKELYPNVWLDVIVANDLDTVKTLFDERTRVNRRFG
jgi:hypothetical protein